jgi:putative transcriptional regulator
MQNTIKVERARKNITQADLAEAIDVSRLTIHSIETGKFNPSILTALKIARFFNIPVNELFMLEETD